MADGIPYNAARPSAGSLLHGWLTNRTAHPDSFACGVRVIAGTIPGEGTRWRYRRSAADPLVADGTVVVQHGSRATLRLVLDEEPIASTPTPSGRPGFVVLGAIERGSGASVQLCVRTGELERFGLQAE